METDSLDQRIRKIISDYACAHCGSSYTPSKTTRDESREHNLKVNYLNMSDVRKEKSSSFMSIKCASEPGSISEDQPIDSRFSISLRPNQTPATPRSGVVIPLKSGETVISHGDAIKKFRNGEIVDNKRKYLNNTSQKRMGERQIKLSLTQSSSFEFSKTADRLLKKQPITTPKKMLSPRSPKIVEFRLADCGMSNSPSPNTAVPKPYPYKSSDSEQPSPNPSKNITINLVESLCGKVSHKTSKESTVRSSFSSSSKTGLNSFRSYKAVSKSSKVLEVMNPIMIKSSRKDETVVPRLKRRV